MKKLTKPVIRRTGKSHKFIVEVCRYFTHSEMLNPDWLVVIIHQAEKVNRADTAKDIYNFYWSLEYQPIAGIEMYIEKQSLEEKRANALNA